VGVGWGGRVNVRSCMCAIATSDRNLHYRLVLMMVINEEPGRACAALVCAATCSHHV